jgi:hypothetical protein
LLKWRLVTLVLLITISGCSFATPVSAPLSPPTTGGSFEVGRHFAFIREAQRASGAIAMTPRQLLINPYFANLAAKALLFEKGNLPHVQRYMEWYLAHLNPDGTIDDYRVEDGAEIASGTYDSSDSYAATFLSLVAAWVEAGGDPGWVSHNRSGLNRIANAVIAVTDSDGLTWAKPGYAYKLLMDNCEVYQGWVDWARLLTRRGEILQAADAHRRANGVRKALPKFQLADGSWGWGIHRIGFVAGSSPDRFYPDAIAQLFPLIWGLNGEAGSYQAFDSAQPQWRHLQASDFPWLLPTYAAALVGDRAAVRQALAQVETMHGDLRWPWFVAESAWAIQAWMVAGYR